MTPDLLQRIAKCAPPEMGAVYVPETTSGKPYVFFRRNVTHCCSLWFESEYCDAQAIIAMLDEMEKAGVAAYVGAMIDEDGVRIPGYECADYDTNECVGGAVEQCPTRAIAIGEAFCKVFEGLR